MTPCPRHPHNVSPRCLFCDGEHQAHLDRTDPHRKKSCAHANTARETPGARKKRALDDARAIRKKRFRIERRVSVSFVDELGEILRLALRLPEAQRGEILASLREDITTRLHAR